MIFLRSSYLLLAIFCITCSGCKKRFGGLEVPYNLFIDIPPGLNPILLHHLNIPDVPGLVDASIQSALPAFVRIVVQDGEPTTDLFREVYLEIFDEESNSYQEIAYRIEPPRGGARNLDLIASIIELKPYVEGQRFDLRLRFRLNYSPTVISTMLLEFSLLVED